jgi:threonine synthase
LKSGTYQPKPSVQTISNAMDVGDPSNWVRIQDMFKTDPAQLAKLITGFSYTDDQNREAIERIYSSYKYIACPHTAIAWQALKDWQQNQPIGRVAGVFLSTAHPCKFPEVLPKHISREIVIPEQVKNLGSKTRQSVALGKSFEAFKAYLLDNK